MAIETRDPYQRVSQAMSRTILHIILLGGAVTMVAPFVWMLSSSLKKNLEVFHIPPTLIPAVPQWHNYIEIFKVVPYSRWFLNSVFIAVTQPRTRAPVCSTIRLRCKPSSS